jgi:CheY-like chemotaxis protein
MQKVVLLIDDDEEEMIILSNAFEIAGIDRTCKWISNTEEALQFLQQTVPDCIFVDLNMPKKNGLACLLEIKSMDSMRDVPIVLYSTSVDGETTKKAREAGVAWCIQKTNSIQSLVKHLNLIFSRIPG